MASLAEKRLARLEEAGCDYQAIAHYLRKLADDLEAAGHLVVGDSRALRMAMIRVPANNGQPPRAA